MELDEPLKIQTRASVQKRERLARTGNKGVSTGDSPGRRSFGEKGAQSLASQYDRSDHALKAASERIAHLKDYF